MNLPNYQNKNAAEQNQIINQTIKNNNYSTIGDIGVLGSGWFGRELGYRLTLAGFKVNTGSRLIATRGVYCKSSGGGGIPGTPVNLHPLGLPVMTFDNVIMQTRSKILFLAIPQSGHQEFCYRFARALAGHILVDVSNGALRLEKSNASFNLAEYTSKAENIQALLPDTAIVKALNNITADNLSNIFSKTALQTCVASNNSIAAQKVSYVIREIGITPILSGLLASAGSLEMHQFLLFPSWISSYIILFGVFFFWALVAILREHVLPINSNWENLPIKTLSLILSSTGITMLCYSFWPAMVVQYKMLIKNHVRLEESFWLASWLSIRKQLGIQAFVCILMHVMLSILPQNRYLTTYTIYDNIALLLGVMSLLIFCIQLFVSLPNIKHELNRREFHFIMSTIGWINLIFSISHGILISKEQWQTKNTPDGLAGFLPIAIINMFLPILTLGAKIILVIPPLKILLNRIQLGKMGSKKDETLMVPVGHRFYPKCYRYYGIK
ncbi:hypothetical protein BB561_000578 [Smittium simulii]|uniref:Pyrroline-5-carboxylate reductase catalytic N-terminal domain-containing protein n=1 Tax=Smittium simulii TaxID=133385 RepID=A0A2T9YYH6_9FUNG|nr:hypothetical protein BB561_000578 [Smittium simulii]